MNWQTNISPSWRLCDVLNVEQAAALIAGFDPGVTYFNNHHVYFENQDGITDNTGAGDVKASFEALKGAISAGVLEAEIINREPSFSYFETNTAPVSAIPDWEKTTIRVERLKNWLKNKNIYPSFFYPERTTENLNFPSSGNTHLQATMPSDVASLAQQFVAAEQEVARLQQELDIALSEISELRSLLGLDGESDEDILEISGKRRIRQVHFIIATTKAFEYDPLAIPDGGKIAIWKICENVPTLFSSESAFDHAWKAATNSRYIRMENHEKFAMR